MTTRNKYKDWLTEEGIKKLKMWALKGLTDKQIADNMGIATSTLNRWKNDYPEIRDSLKENKEIADSEVVNSLYESAKGYYVEESDEVWRLDGSSGEMVLVEKRVHKKYIQPSSTAQVYWLKNRDPKNWRDKREVEVNDVTEDKTVGVIMIPQTEGDYE